MITNAVTAEHVCSSYQGLPTLEQIQEVTGKSFDSFDSAKKWMQEQEKLYIKSLAHCSDVLGLCSNRLLTLDVTECSNEIDLKDVCLPQSVENINIQSRQQLSGASEDMVINVKWC